LRKICIVITARPSYSRVRGVLDILKNSEAVELQIVVAGSAVLERYGKVADQIKQDGFKIDVEVSCVLEGDSRYNMARTTGIAIQSLTNVFEALKPDIVVTIADRYETIATSIAASYSGITLAHIQGGEVTGSIDERVRHANTKLADIHFPSTELAKKRILSMGENPKKVFITGCPSIDIACKINFDKLDFKPERRYLGVGPSLDLASDFCVAMLHPDTNRDNKTEEDANIVIQSLKSFAPKLQVYWFWPNIDAGSDGVSRALRKIRERHDDLPWHFFRSLEPVDFLTLTYWSKFLIGNSSVGIREASFLGIPVINVGNRQQGRERWVSITDCDYQQAGIETAIETELNRSNRFPKNLAYGDGQSSTKIAQVLIQEPLVKEKMFYGEF
jgi:UDP-hydrolysing UDP-N-acetyl-D-glucosamine 2-epimerase